MGRFGFFGEEALSLIVDDLEEDNVNVQDSLLVFEVIVSNEFCNKALSVVEKGMRFLHVDAARIEFLKDGFYGAFFIVGPCTDFLLDCFCTDGGLTMWGNFMCLFFGHEQNKIFDRGRLQIVVFVQIRTLFVCLSVFGDAISGVFWNSIWLEGEEQLEAKKKSDEVLKILDNELKDKKFFGGDKIGLADIAGNFIALWSGVWLPKSPSSKRH